MKYKEYLFEETFELNRFETNIDFEKKVGESFLKEIKDKNLHSESVEILEQGTFEIPHYYKKYGVFIKYSARERNHDDDVRERIEFMIENISA